MVKKEDDKKVEKAEDKKADKPQAKAKKKAAPEKKAASTAKATKKAAPKTEKANEEKKEAKPAAEKEEAPAAETKEAKSAEETVIKEAEIAEQQAESTVSEEEEIKIVDRVVHISRVAKVVKGGRRFSFSALGVCGNGQGEVGFGLGKANEVPDAIRKGSERARKSMIKVPLTHSRTIPHDIIGDYGAGLVVMKKASPGTGVIAGGAVRAVFEAAGVHDILTKCIGTSNPHNSIRATFSGLTRLINPEAEGKELYKTGT